jgi:hypothetical protein
VTGGYRVPHAISVPRHRSKSQLTIRELIRHTPLEGARFTGIGGSWWHHREVGKITAQPAGSGRVQGVDHARATREHTENDRAGGTGRGLTRYPVTVMAGPIERPRVNPEPLLAGSRLASTLVWWPLLTVLYLMAAPGSNPLGVGLVGGGLLVIGLLRATLRASARRHGARDRGRLGGQPGELPGEQPGG